MKRSAFTLIEMVVVITILAILSLIGYVSYSDSIVWARDSQRANDIEKLQIDLKSHKQKEWAYPMPIDPMNITNSGTIVYQGTLTDAVVSNVLSNIPKDPRTSGWYWYSVTSNRQQFQLALTLENDSSPKALVKGDYKSIANTLVPTLILAVTGTTSVDINTVSEKFILNGGSYNLPYDMEWVVVANTSFNLGALKTESGVTVETGGSYFSCDEVYEVGRSVGSGTYQIVNSWSAIVESISCPMNY